MAPVVLVGKPKTPLTNGVGPNKSKINQPPFDPRIKNSLTSPFGSGNTQLQRGFILWDPTLMGFAGGSAYINFLFNPSTISASYQITNATAQAALIFPTVSGGAGAQPIQRVPLQQQVGFSIMFDRTYEMNSSGTSANIQNLGVDVDVLMMKQLTGQFLSVYQGNNPYIDPTTGNTVGQATPGSQQPRNVNTGNGTGTGVNQGVMQMTFCYVYFGNPNVGIKFYGYIDSWEVQYTHFSQGMIPMRCVIDISFTLLPPPSANGTPAAAATHTKTQVGGIFPTPTGARPPVPIGVLP